MSIDNIRYENRVKEIIIYELYEGLIRYRWFMVMPINYKGFIWWPFRSN